MKEKNNRRDMWHRRTSASLGIMLAMSSIASTSSFQTSSPRLQRHLHHAPSNPPFGGRTGPSSPPPTVRRDATALGAVTPAAALTAVGSPLGSVAVLAFVILVHEAGHFLAARSLGISVDEFSVGVGPRVVGVRRSLVDGKFVYEKINSEDEGESDEPSSNFDDGIEFSLRALPFGGYVRFPENYNRTLAFEMEDAARKARNEARMMRVEGSTAMEKALEAIAANSFVFNLLTLGLVKKWQSKRVEEQLKQAEEEFSSSRKGKLGVGKRNGAWSALPWVAAKESGDDVNEKGKLAILRAAKGPEIDYFDDPNLLQNRPWSERAVVLSGGVVFNILLAFVCYLGQLTGGKGLPQPVFDGGAVVSQMPGKESPSFGLLNQGDIILGVNDVITSAARSDSGMWASQKEISNVISNIRETPVGESVKLTIVHGRNSDSTDTVSIVPLRSNEGVATIGVSLGPNYLRTDVVRASSVVDAVSKAGSAVCDLTAQTARSILGVLASFLSGKGAPAGASLSGPIGVVKTGAELVSSSDFAAVVAFAASISVNLAVINSLPLPALDGGQLAFVLAEAAAGRRIDQRVQEGINAGAILILLFISVGTAVRDVTSILI